MLCALSGRAANIADGEALGDAIKQKGGGIAPQTVQASRGATRRLNGFSAGPGKADIIIGYQSSIWLQPSFQLHIPNSPGARETP